MLVKDQCPALIPIEDAARELRTTSVNVYMHIKRKLIVGREVDGEWFIEADSFARFLAQSGGKATGLIRKHCQKGGGCGDSCH